MLRAAHSRHSYSFRNLLHPRVRACSLNLRVSRDKSLILTAPDLRMTWKANWSGRGAAEGDPGKRREEREERRIDGRTGGARSEKRKDGKGRWKRKRTRERNSHRGGRTGHLDLTAQRTRGRTWDCKEGIEVDRGTTQSAIVASAAYSVECLTEIVALRMAGAGGLRALSVN